VRALLPIPIVAALFTSCGNGHETTTPTVGPITESVYASGLVKAAGQYQVFPTVNGTVLELLVKEGDTVAAGQPLLRIDDRASSLTSRTADAQMQLLERNAQEAGPILGQLKEALAQAQEKLAVDSVNFVRQSKLWDQQIGSKAELDQRELAYATSKAARNRATQALAETRNRLRTELQVARNNAALGSAGNDDRTPRSLLNGVVYDLMIEPGELATTQRPVALIGAASDFLVELEVDEYDITKVQTGQKVMISLDSYEGTVFAGTLTRIVPSMDQRSRTFRVEATFKQQPPKLYPNLTAEASIVLDHKENALTIPTSYLIDGAYVLTAPEERTAVKVGARDLEKAEILDGVDAGTTLYKP
jgi:HlyD family secretion protein